MIVKPAYPVSTLPVTSVNSRRNPYRLDLLRIHPITEITRLKGLVFKVSCLLLGCLLWACNQPDRHPSSSIPETFSARDAYAQARVLADSAEFDSSNRAFERAAVVFEQQQNWSLYLDCLNGMAANEKETSNIAKATGTLHQVVEKGLQLLGDTSAAVAQSYAYLGEIVLRQGKLLQADSLFQLSLGIRERRFGRHHPATAESIADIGMVLLQKGDLNGALALEEEALRIRLEGLNERPSEVAASYKYLGGLYNGMGNPDKALEFFQKSLAIYQRIKGHKHPELGRISTNLGVMYSIRGNSQQAKAYYQKALAVLERPGTKTSAIANIYNNIAILYFENGDYEEAISYYNNALGIFHATIGENTPDVARVYSNIGSSFDRLGNFDQALAYYEKSRLIRVALTTPKDLSLAPVYLNLGSVYGGKGAYEKAFEYYGKVLDIHLPTTGEVNPQVAICYQAMADTYFKQQKYPDAAQFYGKALRVFRQTLGKHYQEVGHIYTSLGDVAMGQHQPDSALAYYQQALVSLVPGYDGTNLYANPTPTHVISQPYLVNALAAKANALSERYKMVSHDLGDLRFALATFEFASQWIDQLRHSYKGENAKLFLSQNANQTYRDAVRTAALLYTQTRENTFLERAFTFSERMKATVLLDVIKKVSAQYAAGLPDSVSTREEELKTSVAFYEKQIFDENQKGSLADKARVREGETRLAECKRQYSEWIRRLETEYPDYYRLKYDPKIASLRQVQQRLKPDQALIEYALGDSLVYVFVITPRSYSLTQVTGAPAVESQVQGLRDGLLQNDFINYTRSAHALYKTLIAPLRAGLQEVKKLLVIPDGVLGYVPFEVLLQQPVLAHRKDYASLSYLIRDYNIGYHYSATLFAENTASAEGDNGQFLGFAPDFNQTPVRTPPASTPVAFNDTTRESLQPLAGAKEEVQAIAKIIPGQYFLDRAATEGQFKKLAQRYGVLHLATHAVMNDRNPAFSKLIFATDTSSVEDGYLYTYELYNLKLRAQLVTLSACNTGFGKMQRGEGVMSLARGFSYTGCSSVLMSLWPASDRSTAQVMPDFYQGLTEGLPKDEALYRAKMAYLSKADALTANPYFWGSFVMIGDPAPLRQTNAFPLRWLVALGGGLSLLAAYFWVRGRKKKGLNLP